MKLQPNERQRCTKIIANLPEFSELRGRQNLLTQTDLELFRSVVNLDGHENIVAGQLMSTLEKYGFLRDRPQYNALGALLSYVVDMEAILPDDRQFLAGLLVKYGLVTDGDYIEKLRQDFNLQNVAPPAAAHIRPPTPVPQVAEPAIDFTPPDAEGLERILNSEENFIDISMLAAAIYCAQAVCRIDIPENQPEGTGFLIGPDLVLTNRHVVRSPDMLGDVVLRFGHLADLRGVANTADEKTFKLQSDFYHWSDEQSLDYALVRLNDCPLKHLAPDEADNKASISELIQKGKHRGYLACVPRYITDNERLNIIQHPDGRPMKVVLTQNHVVSDMTDTRVHYVADTMPGSSGSPAFNRNWEVVALHHSGKPYPPQAAADALKKAWKGAFRVNEGIPMKAILDDFKAKGIDKLLPQQ